VQIHNGIAIGCFELGRWASLFFYDQGMCIRFCAAEASVRYQLLSFEDELRGEIVGCYRVSWIDNATP